MKAFADIKGEEDLLGPGAAPGTVPTDLEQSTGLERLEILGKMDGVDIFDMRPLDSSRKGTIDNPIMVKSAGDEQYAGCTGSPADSHVVTWLGMSRERPMERCPECGSVYKMDTQKPSTSSSIQSACRAASIQIPPVSFMTREDAIPVGSERHAVLFLKTYLHGQLGASSVPCPLHTQPTKTHLHTIRMRLRLPHNVLTWIAMEPCGSNQIVWKS
ncbi:hypothetical protein JX265_006995 [Neoarthrinium moseri]|uniref:Cytochrome c oxidase subunit 4, mitochondrial n=1 Tax=Neoarthrinium moseri TaxID=1658444 RepID=A0A9P9WKD4_9PEZI|nr:uncharacterized protein JN550_007945 [Neoarthrinium moseri]KAI1865967.1 hypothetical protein JN550_007945 [Neoarthrinium moseri]KAI1868172.1 hypothetical protein JX265_006995 [Neoarthrinium moseri]